MAKQYLKMTPTELFENYTIDEIITIQKDIQYEIDKKRQELRTMVGERYRDVIEASDTIKVMQRSANEVVRGIDDIINLCREIDKIKDSFGQEREETEEERLEREQQSLQNGITMQIKILIYIPEQIWTAIDDKEYLKATQLYLFAQHIYTGLKFDQNVYVKYPIIKSQWMKIEHFHKRINSHLNSELKRNNLTAEMAADYLAAYVLLENISVTKLLDQLIEFRKFVLQNELKSDVSGHNTVKSLTCSALKLIVNTIQLIYLCFIDSGNGTGLVYEKLTNIVKKEAEPTLNIVELVDDPLIECLPKLVSEFRPILTHTVDLISPSNAGASIQTWLDWVKQSIIVDLSQRLNMVTSIKGLDNIREEALKIEIVDNWEILCQKLSLPRNFNVWFLIFQPLITDRVRKLIEIKWNQIVTQTEHEVSEALAKASSGKTAKPELDLRWFTWKEEKSDVPLKFNFDGENKFVAKGLLMKSKGYSPNVIELCENFDNRLSKMLTDLDVYLFGKDVHSERAIVRADIFLSKINNLKQTAFEKYSDKTEIQNHLQQVSKQQMERLVSKILEKSENNILTTNERMSYNLMTARLLLALQQLSPNLLKCFKREGKTSQWNDICSYLQEKRLQSWSGWLNDMDERLSQLIATSLNQCRGSSINNMLEFYPQWSSIEIEEKTEDSVVKSYIRIPSQPNFILQNILFQICSKLNTIIPATLPKQTHIELVERIIENILNIYKLISSDDQENLMQSQALQFLFDIKYLNLMFISRENKKLTKLNQDICEAFRSKIDPFDYDVFYPHIQQGVLLSAQKTQSILGILIIKPEQLTTVLGAKTNVNILSHTPDKDAMVLPLADTSNVWFPLLPVTAPVVSRNKNATMTTAAPQVETSKVVEKKKVTKASPKHTKNTDNSSTSNLVRSGATSFLSDWFGG